MSDEFIDKLVRSSELQNGLGYGGDPDKIAGPYAWTSSEELKVNWAANSYRYSHADLDQ